MRYPQGQRTTVALPNGESVVVRSRLEAGVLTDLFERGVPCEYESRKLAYVTEHTYTPDIVLMGDNGLEILVEVKGRFLPSDRSKLLNVKRTHPDVDLRLLFQRAEHRLSRKSKTTYGSWCERHGFPWAEGRVPQVWLEELKG